MIKYLSERRGRNFVMASDFRSRVETQILKKKAPKLKPLDRTVSLAIENYAAGNNVSSHSGIAYDLTHLDSPIVLTPTSSHSAASASSATQEFTKKSNIFYIDSSSTSLNNYPDYKHPHTHHLPRKHNIVRRSGALDAYATGTYDIRKTNSFNSKPKPISSAEDLLLMSRRTNSMRHTSGGAAAAYTHEFSVASDATIIPPISVGDVVGGAASISTNRRNCRMHKSFHERRFDTKRDAAIETVKCHSLGDDGSDDDTISGVKRKLSPKFNSANASLENEVFHTRSNSRNKIETETIDVHDSSATTAVVITPSMSATGSGAVTHKHSSHSLDKPHHNFRRIARATQSFYLNPNQYEELRLQRAMQNAAAAATTSTGSGVTFASAAKRVHSASLRTKPFRETLVETKKSKSFVSDPFVEYDLSGHRRDSKLFDSGVSVISDVKKSPRLSSNLLLSDAANFDGNDLAEYDGIMRAYRQNRNSSVVSGGGGGGGGAKKKLSSKKKKTVDGVTSETGLADDGDGESTRKRKRIVCIIVSVFLSLVFASVFVVVFTMTHSSVTQVPDQTRRIYTFAPGPVGNRDSPIHHHNNGNYNHQW